MDWDKRLSLFIAGRAEGEDLCELLRIAERAGQFDEEMQHTVQKALDEVVGTTEEALSHWQAVAKERAEEIERLCTAVQDAWVLIPNDFVGPWALAHEKVLAPLAKEMTRG